MSFKKDAIVEIIQNKLPQKSLLVKYRANTETGSFVFERSSLLENDAHFICCENSASYEVHTDPKHDFGIYLDTKSARSFVRENSKDKTVLNLFSYTCPFGVAAMLGGAKVVTNIDPNKDYLAWGKRNAELNNLEYKCYPDTTQTYLKRHLRRLESGKDEPFDLIIVDPPAFLVGRGSDRLARNLWPSWMEDLKASKCREFIFVINDKSLGRNTDLNVFFKDGLGSNISIKEIEQSIDVIGSEPMASYDHFYFTPKVFSITR